MVFSSIKTEDLYLLGKPGFLSLHFFIGSILFTVLSIIGIYDLVKRMKSMRKFLKIYLILTMMAFIELNLVLLSWGWIGMRMWV